MKTQKINLRFGIISIVILLAAFSRLIPHPPNYTPVGAMALFGAAYFSKRYLAFLVPISAMVISDMVLNNVLYAQYFDGFVFFYSGFYWTYAAFIGIGLIGMHLLKKTKPHNILLASLSASILFFVVSNFGVWASGVMYPKDFSGLVACYTTAIPFFQNTVLGDFVYSGVLFGAFEFAQYKFPQLKLKTLSNGKNMSSL